MEPVHYLLMLSNTLVHQRILAQAAEIGLTPGQPKVLECLMTHEGCDQKTLAAHCAIKPSTIGDILTGMEKKGLIARRQTDGNRRSWRVYLTDQGRKAAAELAAIFAQADAFALQGLDPADAETLKALLKQMIETMEAENQKGKRLNNGIE